MKSEQGMCSSGDTAVPRASSSIRATTKNMTQFQRHIPQNSPEEKGNSGGAGEPQRLGRGVTCQTLKPVPPESLPRLRFGGVGWGGWGQVGGVGEMRGIEDKNWGVEARAWGDSSQIGDGRRLGTSCTSLTPGKAMHA